MASFDVHIESLEKRLVCQPQETLLEMLERYGYRMPRSCRNGVCEICEYQLLSGVVTQRYPEKSLSCTKNETPVIGLACTSTPLSEIWVNIKGLKSPGEQSVKRFSCDIEQVEKLSYDVFKVSLSLPATASKAVSFHAGQYLEIFLPDGRQAAFSIGSAPEQGRKLELHVRLNTQSDLSAAILEHLTTQPSVEIELPKGSCFVQAPQISDDSPIVLVAASTGFAQIKSMVEHLIANQVANPIHIYWGARIAADIYMPDLPKAWEQQYTNIIYHPVVSEPSAQCGWAGRVDLLPAAICADFPALDNVQVYASGSPAMVYALLDACEAKGLPESSMHSDVFAYAPRPKK